MKKIFIVCLILSAAISISAYARITKKDIVKAQLGRFVIERVENVNLSTGEKTVSIRFKATGVYIDEDGKASPISPKIYELEDLPEATQNQLIEIFKNISRKYNKDLAHEDVDTFDTTTITSTTTTTTVP